MVSALRPFMRCPFSVLGHVCSTCWCAATAIAAAKMHSAVRRALVERMTTKRLEKKGRKTREDDDENKCAIVAVDAGTVPDSATS